MFFWTRMIIFVKEYIDAWEISCYLCRLLQIHPHTSIQLLMWWALSVHSKGFGRIPMYCIPFRELRRYRDISLLWNSKCLREKTSVHIPVFLDKPHRLNRRAKEAFAAHWCRLCLIYPILVNKHRLDAPCYTERKKTKRWESKYY